MLDYAYGAASLVMPSVLAKLGADVLVVNPLVSTVGMLGFDRDGAARPTSPSSSARRARTSAR